MPLTDTQDLFAKALHGKYAIGAFNVNNMEILQAVIETCEEEKAPVILQFSKEDRECVQPIYLKKLIEAAVSLSTIPIAVHLDSGDSFELCKECLDEGFTSVLVNGSHEPFEKHVEACRTLVEYAHRRHSVVEGRLNGRRSDQEDGEASEPLEPGRTEPEEAVSFVRATGVSSLAIDIGPPSAPAKGRSPKHLDLDHLKAVKEAFSNAGMEDFPLVLPRASTLPSELVQEINRHGGKVEEEAGGVPETDIEMARRVGCTKVDIDTDLQLAMTAGIRQGLAQAPSATNPKECLLRGKAKVKELVRHLVRNVLCSSGHGFD